MRIVTAAPLVALIVLGAAIPAGAQNARQTLAISLVAYDQPQPNVVRTLRFTTKDVIRYLTGSNVISGQLFLVTPLASGILTNTGNMNSFLRITSRGATIMEVPTPDSFNFFQDSVVTVRRPTTTTSYATDRYSIDFGGFHAELQAFNIWTAPHEGTRTPANRVTGIGSFQSSTVTGEGTIDGVTQGGVPMAGSITSGTPTTGP
jgi:hypothetical protein